jgi:hypothetical protein
MTDSSKIKTTHTQRAACVYIRQSTPSQVEYNRESTARQYALSERACQLGWPKEQVVVIDEDLGISGSGIDKRSGFARLTSEVLIIRLLQQTPMGSVEGCPGRRSPKRCASFNPILTPKRSASST